MMAKRITGLGMASLQYFPVLSVLLAIYQYYREAGGVPGFLNDIKNFNMKVLEQKWTTVAMGIAFFVGADIVSRYVPGKMRHVVKAIMYYLGASQMLSVMQGMWMEAPVQVQTQTQAQNGFYNGGMY